VKDQNDMVAKYVKLTERARRGKDFAMNSVGEQLEKDYQEALNFLAQMKEVLELVVQDGVGINNYPKSGKTIPCGFTYSQAKSVLEKFKNWK